jgi:hypothetical protein
MPSRKQRRRAAKSKRHEYEFVYVDSEGNELDEVPDELVDTERERAERRNGSKAAAAATVSKKAQPQRGRRTPPEPSWNRAVKRGALLGVVVFILFSLTSKGSYVSVIPLAIAYTALFIPFTYFIDRFAYRRWQARQGQQPGGAASKKR